MFHLVSFGMTARHAASLAQSLREDAEFCTPLVGADRAAMASAVETSADACKMMDKQLSLPTNTTTYDIQLGSDVLNYSNAICSAVYVLDNESDGGQIIVGHDVLQQAVSQALEAARALRVRSAQIAQFVERATAPATASKSRAKAGRR